MLTKNNARFIPDALSVRLANECARLGITSRAQALAAWAGLSAAQRTMFLGKLIIGAMAFPDDPPLASPYAIGGAASVPGPGE